MSRARHRVRAAWAPGLRGLGPALLLCTVLLGGCGGEGPPAAGGDTDEVGDGDIAREAGAEAGEDVGPGPDDGGASDPMPPDLGPPDDGLRDPGPPDTGDAEATDPGPGEPGVQDPGPPDPGPDPGPPDEGPELVPLDTSGCPVVTPEPRRPQWGGSCSVLHARRCLSDRDPLSPYLVCEDPDQDGCPNWSLPRACPGVGTCFDGACVCTPSCDGKECGGDDCGGRCGSCPEGLSCAMGACIELEAAEEGTIIWERELVGTLEPVAVDDEGVIYTTDGLLYAINPDGSMRWLLATGVGDFEETAWACGAGTPVMIGDDGTLYVGCEAGHNGLLAVSPEGELLWWFETGGPVLESGALGYDGEVYFCDGTGTLWAVDGEGEEIWSVQGECADEQGLNVEIPSVGPSGLIWLGNRALDPVTGERAQTFVDIDFALQTSWLAHAGAETALLLGRGGLVSSVFLALDATITQIVDHDFIASFSTLDGSGVLYAAARNRGILRVVPSGEASILSAPPTGSLRTGVTIGDDGILYGSQVVLGTPSESSAALYAFDKELETVVWRIDGSLGVMAILSPHIGVWAAGATVSVVRISSTGLAENSWPRVRSDNRNSSRAPR